MRLLPSQQVHPTFDRATGKAVWPAGPHPCGCDESGCRCDAPIYTPHWFMCTPCSMGRHSKRGALDDLSLPRAA